MIVARFDPTVFQNLLVSVEALLLMSAATSVAAPAAAASVAFAGASVIS